MSYIYTDPSETDIEICPRSIPFNLLSSGLILIWPIIDDYGIIREIVPLYGRPLVETYDCSVDPFLSIGEGSMFFDNWGSIPIEPFSQDYITTERIVEITLLLSSGKISPTDAFGQIEQYLYLT